MGLRRVSARGVTACPRRHESECQAPWTAAQVAGRNERLSGSNKQAPQSEEVMEMVSAEDHAQLERAAELVLHVMQRHRSGDLRAVTIFHSVLQEIKVAERYLRAERSTPRNGPPTRDSRAILL